MNLFLIKQIDFNSINNYKLIVEGKWITLEINPFLINLVHVELHRETT